MSVPSANSSRDMGRIILRNSVAATAGTWGIKLLNFLFIIYVIRLLGETGLGRYATVVAFVGLFSVFVELGLSQYVERDIARDPRRARELFWNLVALRFLLAIAGVVVVTGLGVVAGYDREILAGIFLFTLTFLMASFLTPLTTLLTANERFDYSSAILVVNQLITMGLGLFLLSIGWGFFALLATGFVAMPVQIVLTILAVRRCKLGSIPFRLNPKSWKALVVAGLPFGLTTLALVFNANVDTVILGFFHSDATVGWYNAAYRLIFNAVGIAGGFLIVMTPSIAREHVLNPDHVRRWVRAGLRWMIIFSIPASAGLCLLAGRTIGTLYGASYLPAAIALVILAWDIPLMLLNSFFGNVTAAVGLERPAAKIYLVSAGLNVVLNLALIPAFGIVAAAAITVATDLISVGIFLALLNRRMELLDSTYGLPRIALATALMAACVWLASPLPYPVVIAIGAVSYLVAAVSLGVLEWSFILAQSRRLLHRSPTATT